MARRSTTRAPKGNGTIRKRKDGSYEACYTIGRDPGTGKQIQKSIYGKTEKEVAKKLRQVTHELDNGSYFEPARMTLGSWLDIWIKEYTGGIGELTKATYETQVRVHLKPALGAAKLSELKTHQIQLFINSLNNAPKTVRNIFGVLHRSLAQAMKLHYIRMNPCDGVELPKQVKPEMHPLESSQMGAFLAALKGSDYMTIFMFTMFTGLRQGEAMGLTWDRINFDAGTILIDRQLIHEKKKGGVYKFAPPKYDKIRKLTPAPSVMELLKARKKEQSAQRLKAGPLWDDEGLPGLVFTQPTGKHYANSTLTHRVTEVGIHIGVNELCFHDLRHTYAVAAIRAGDDIKTLSANLGHATVAFTLDRYGHYTNEMHRDSSEKMEMYIKPFLTFG